MTNNPIPNVPRELLERVKSLCEYWFVRGQQQHLSESEHKTWHALGFGSSAFTELRALLSAPSPAGVDGLDGVSERIAKVWIGHAHIDDLITIGKEVDAAQAIIEGLRGAVERSKQFAAGHVLTNERISESLHAAEAERDQQARRIGELEGLLREVRNGLSCENLHHKKSEQHAFDEPCKVLGRIDAALSAGKEGE